MLKAAPQGILIQRLIHQQAAILAHTAVNSLVREPILDRVMTRSRLTGPQPAVLTLLPPAGALSFSEAGQLGQGCAV